VPEEPTPSTSAPARPTAPAAPTAPGAPVPAATTSAAPERGTVYRARRRPGLTRPGVAVILAAISLVAGLLNGFLTGGTGLLFGVPFIAASVYVAAEVRWADRWSVLVAPPLVLLVTLLVVEPVTSSSGGGLRDTLSGVLVALVASAPMLVTAEAGAGIALGLRWWAARTPAHTPER
jgi:hypothetical protein